MKHCNSLTFVIPVYNVGGSKLDRCLTSVTAFKLRYPGEVKVIVVNDRSPMWLEEYRVAKIHSDMIIYAPVNVGLGAARNIGLAKVYTEWVWFVDSDDSIVIDTAKYIGEILSNRDEDIIQMGGYQITGNGSEIEPLYMNVWGDGSYTGVEALKRNYKIAPSVWSKIYRVDFLRDNNLRNPEGVLYEDQEFLFDCLTTPGCRLYSSTMNTYNYYINPGSIMTSPPSDKKILDAHKVAITCQNKLWSYLLTNGLNFRDFIGRFKEYDVLLESRDKMMKTLPLMKRIKLGWKILLWNLENDYR